jgi:hypothetical protein
MQIALEEILRKTIYQQWWYHHLMTTATAQAAANIAFTMYSEEKLD